MYSENKILIQIGNRLKKQRKELDLTLEDIATLTGLSKGYISNIEKGIKSPSLITFIKLINALNVSSDRILKNENKISKLQITTDNINEIFNDLDEKELNLLIDIIKSIKKNRNIE
ncbi:HTH-type transcriptional regulator [Clostridioides difficile]|uniref:helix-turn-helix domain-containing protein n=1 Tax=Clostridioides difficile TaxID=1496 RepID=UPI0010264E45|nr:helix-turn-helix transcriptional regulator [Clostridioides difficile]VFF93666.1 HTH-type transcriptional regulator [Clostridioides difficile]VIG08990.1 HTH-type transcriptional regulator [Clostridioides difficile]HBF4772691.1 helix-turn-helix transcriptional regulator [Clostridioides difficile]HBF5038240.1 helix-turn-helix transcriptional regulator [Clostridioides difficile]HBF5411098.1 helix-turn-helix transcriptional regulator [Clostridioides difficile]